MKFSSLIIISALATILTGCGSAKAVKMKPGKGGIVTVSNRSNQKSMEKARAIMSETCQGQPYKIVEEGRTTVGKVTESSGSKESKGVVVGSIFGNSESSKNEQTRGTTVTKDVTEWQIKFECSK